MDPLAEEFIGQSPYIYVSNNPLNLIDPTGMGEESPLTDFINIDTGERTHIDDGKDQVIAGNTELINTMKDAFKNNKEDYNSSLTVLESSDANLNMTSNEFSLLVETVYAESSGGLRESLGIVNVLENRVTNQGNSITDQLSDKSPYGVFGVRKTGNSSYKFSYNNEKGSAADKKRANVNMAAAIGLITSNDVTNGAYFWDGKDFNGKNNINGGYRARYAPGYLFTNPSHDLWGQGSNKVNGTYKHESTSAIGNTTFSKFHNQGSKWYISK